MGTLTGNENNPATLKLLVANNLAEAKYGVNIIGHQVEGQYLPYLILSSGESIFIPNAGLWLLCPPPEDIAERVREILELEATILSSSLASLLGSNLKSEKLKIGVLSCLQELNSILDRQDFFLKDKITIADVAVFSTLYPIFKSEKLSKEYLANVSHITQWLRRLESLPEFKEAISVVFHQKSNIGSLSYQILFQNSLYLNSQLEAEQPKDSHKSDLQGTFKQEAEVVSTAELQAAERAWKKGKDALPKLKQQGKVVLPKPGEKNVFITSALPYVNNVPHLGNIIGCVLSADVFARFSRLCNNNTLFICGTDEYGTATETKALEEGLTCRAICDKYFKVHSDIYKWFDISFDYFGRTSTPAQTEIVQDIFLQLNGNGFMTTESVDQLHCEKCDRFLADRFVEGGCPNLGCSYEDARGDQCDGCGKLINAVELKNPRCKVCRSTPKLKSSTQFFIDLPKLEPLIRHWIKKPCLDWSHNADVISKAWLKEGLKSRCITRDLKWGVPVPLKGYESKVFYVWFDAPIGYISITKAYTKDYEKWWLPSKDTEVKYYQFMAKDNVPFHAIMFPAMLLGTNKGYLNVTHLMATEYLNYEDGKFSKSRGIGVFGNDARDTSIPSDVWRFYLLYVRPETQDSNFSWNDLATKNNSELLNNLGNFVNRSLTFLKNSFNKTIPKMELTSEDYALLVLCTRELRGYVSALQKCKLRDGIRHILAISRHGNQYMQVNQPWAKIKEGEQGKLRSGTVVGVCVNLACLLSTLLQPYMPETSSKLKAQLNCTDVVLNLENIEIVNLLPTGHQIGDPQPLFSKIEGDQVDEYKKRFAGTQESRISPVKNAPKTELGKVDVKALEEEVAKQALAVRQLKEGGKAKSVWEPEVKKLLALKQRLAEATGGATQNGSKGKK